MHCTYWNSKSLVLGMWNVTSLATKEPELVCEFEKLQLDTIELASKLSVSSGTISLERGWTLFHFGVAPDERGRARVSIVIAPLHLWVVGRRVLTVFVSVHQTTFQSTHLSRSGTWRVLPLGTSSFCWGNSMLMWAMTARAGHLHLHEGSGCRVSFLSCNVGVSYVKPFDWLSLKMCIKIDLRRGRSWTGLQIHFHGAFKKTKILWGTGQPMLDKESCCEGVSQGCKIPLSYLGSLY